MKRSVPLPLLIVEDEDGGEFAWMRDAACKDANTELFFQNHGLGNGYYAKRICSECVVRSPCLEYAIEYRLTVGVFGGMNEKERRLEIYRRRREAKYRQLNAS